MTLVFLPYLTIYCVLYYHIGISLLWDRPQDYTTGALGHGFHDLRLAELTNSEISITETTAVSIRKKMADLDAELLALAGGDSGDESVPSSPKLKSPSPVRTSKQSRESPQPEVARKGVAKTTKKAKRRRHYSDDEVEM